MKQMQVEFRQLRRIGIGIMGNVIVVPGVAPDQTISLRNLAGRTVPFEEVALRNAGHREISFGNRNFRSAGHENANNNAIAVRVSSENGERVMVARIPDADHIFVQLSFSHDFSPCYRFNNIGVCFHWYRIEAD